MPASQTPPEKMMFQLSLRRRGISDQAVLRAMEAIPRELFVAAADRAEAYRDSALGIACGQTISQPFVVAYMTEQLQLQKHHCVLGIRTFVGEGSSLEDTVVMGADFYEGDEHLERNLEKGRPHLGIGKNCRIKGAIIDKNARIGDGCVLVADGKADGTYADGAVIIRDGVLVVPKGAVLSPGTVV